MGSRLALDSSSRRRRFGYWVYGLGILLTGDVLEEHHLVVRRLEGKYQTKQSMQLTHRKSLTSIVMNNVY